ncbi:Tigger transposable element-derived protein 4 [Thelohanellus kitauei]|uniref:Tigger transposable element-derived protein 4 n=1 Tax=Thelohanellus kitauei TaxID=669202 RepID=A0A0C2N7L4_THEKT|nr:Tigger transposable element-derived protein 4 [Thelohanellus kitauei]
MAPRYYATLAIIQLLLGQDKIQHNKFTMPLLYDCLKNTHVPKAKRRTKLQLVFFPPNTVSNSKPVDQGIIENLKHHYKKLLLCHMLQAIDEGKEFNLTLLDNLHVARRAWEQVGKSTIRNCFAKAKFIKEEIQTDAKDAELIETWEALAAEEKMHESEEIELSDFLEAADASPLAALSH